MLIVILTKGFVFIDPFSDKLSCIYIENLKKKCLFTDIFSAQYPENNATKARQKKEETGVHNHNLSLTLQ